MGARLFGLLLAGCSGGPVGAGDGIVDPDEVPGPGWAAELVGTAHDVAGTAVIQDDGTIRIADFTYDGGGPDARFFLLADGEAFHRDFELTGGKVGDAHDGEPLVLELPAGDQFESWNLITFWCVAFSVSFGDGVFQPPAE